MFAVSMLSFGISECAVEHIHVCKDTYNHSSPMLLRTVKHVS